MLGKGRAAAITDQDIEALALDIGCHPADLEAVAEVESGGFGWYPDGRIKILFEKHWFWKLLEADRRLEASRRGLARKAWKSPAAGGYKDQKSANQRYHLLERAMKMDKEAALKSHFNGQVSDHGLQSPYLRFCFCRSYVGSLS